ncbi:hypothetical protein RUM43_005066 [Polyplax serrata]|uniref:Uncharacterized protein n=1 Tax=Polyplax serrata TaxID=468196 RepID=A0AAN8XP95_POLSC
MKKRDECLDADVDDDDELMKGRKGHYHFLFSCLFCFFRGENLFWGGPQKGDFSTFRLYAENHDKSGRVAFWSVASTVKEEKKKKKPQQSLYTTEIFLNLHF